MKILEVRRHTMRRKPGEHLSQDGVHLAQLIGRATDSFSIVVTSSSPRAIETAIAMGFEIHETLDSLRTLPSDVFDELRWPSSFSQVKQIVSNCDESLKFAEEQAKLWQSIVEGIPDCHRALIVTHGGIVELGAVASLPKLDYYDWGEAIGYCEGIQLHFDGTFKHGKLLRVPDKYHLIEN